MKCAICLAVVDRQAAPAETQIGGDAVCGAHVTLRAAADSLAHAIQEAQADREAVQLGGRARWS